MGGRVKMNGWRTGSPRHAESRNDDLRIWGRIPAGTKGNRKSEDPGVGAGKDDEAERHAGTQAGTENGCSRKASQAREERTRPGKKINDGKTAPG